MDMSLSTNQILGLQVGIPTMCLNLLGQLQIKMDSQSWFPLGQKVAIYRMTGYFRSRKFRITHAKLNFEGFIFVHFQLQDNLSIRDLLSKSFIFEGVALFEIFENKTPSKITRYTVAI